MVKTDPPSGYLLHRATCFCLWTLAHDIQAVMLPPPVADSRPALS